MRKLAWFVLVIGILDIVTAVGFYIGASYAIGFAWLGAYDLYAAVDLNGIIDQEKLRAYDPSLAEYRALGQRLVSVPAGAGLSVTRVAAVLLGGSGMALCIAGIMGLRARDAPPPVTAGP